MAVSDNLGLYLPDREDYISVQRDLKSNYEIIDEHAGMVEDGIAIVINGDTAPRAITSGQYLMIKNHSTLATGGYHATANIANGASVTSSNVVADSDGIANALNSKLTWKTILSARSSSSDETINTTGLSDIYIDIAWTEFDLSYGRGIYIPVFVLSAYPKVLSYYCGDANSNGIPDKVSITITTTTIKVTGTYRGASISPLYRVIGR